MWGKKRKEKLYSTFCRLAKYFKEEKTQSGKLPEMLEKLYKDIAKKLLYGKNQKTREMFIVFLLF